VNDLSGLEHALGVRFKDRELLRAALVHGSRINETALPEHASNERLEFLGDAVLGLVVAQWLYEREPTANEGRLTRMRSVLVRKETLARIARNLGLGSYLVMGRGEEQAGGRDREANLANACEAIVGAMFLDQDLDTVRETILRLYTPIIADWGTHAEPKDTKSRLQEIVQARWKVQPSYLLLRAEGLPHDQVFTVEVRVDKESLGQGTGRSKRAAEADAARDALRRLESLAAVMPLPALDDVQNGTSI
jgi:ribonuclease-3